VGEHSNFILVPMMLQALKQINQWKPKAIQEYCKTITQKPLALLREAGFWIEDESTRGYHLFGIRLPEGVDMEMVKKRIVKSKFRFRLEVMLSGFRHIYTIPKTI
jgi:hypothetical protein